MPAGRPRTDRADRIVLTAAHLFRTRGFRATSIDDIGRSESISGPAVYRHFASKDDLLAAVAMRGIRRVGERLSGVDPVAGDEVVLLRRSVEAAGQAVIDDLDSVVVALRDVPQLPEPLRGQVVEHAAANSELLAAVVSAARPELSRCQVDFMLQSLWGMYHSLAHFRPTSSRSHLEKVWTVIGTAAMLSAPDLRVDPGTSPAAGEFGETGVDTSSPQLPTFRRRASRREMILAQATVLFRERGFGGVGIDEIGAAAGIVGTAVYRHFESKEDILAAVMLRASEQLAASASSSLAAPSPRVALDRIVESYVQTAIEHADVIAVYLAEAESLPEAANRTVRRAQRAFVEDWRLLVSDLAPHHDPDDSRAAVHAAIGLVNGYAQGSVRPDSDVASTLLTSMTRHGLDAFLGTELS